MFVFAQSNNKNSNLTEDRIKVIVNEQTRIIENELKKKQDDQLKIYQQEFELRAKTVEQKINFLNWLTAIFGVLIGGGIIGTIWGLIRSARGYASKKTVDAIEFAIFKLDPRRWPIRIPRNDFDAERKRLESLKFNNLIPYDGLDSSCKEGITVFRAYSNEDLDKLFQFEKDEKVNPFKCFFVIYYTGKENLETNRLGKYDNFILSRMPSTLTNSIFTASRNIIYD